MSRLAWAFLFFIASPGRLRRLRGGKRTGLWNRCTRRTGCRRTFAHRSQNAEGRAETRKRTDPVVLDVNPAIATSTEEPKFYSDKNSQAANRTQRTPDVRTRPTDRHRETEASSGRRSTSCNPPCRSPRRTPAQVARPKAPPAVAMVKPDVVLRPENGTMNNRGRTLKEALLRQNRTQLAGDRINRTARKPLHLVPSFDAKATRLARATRRSSRPSSSTGSICWTT